MKTNTIVSQLDPRGNILDRFVLRGIHHSVDSLVLERSVERLCPSVVPAHSRAPHRGANAIGVEVVQELECVVFLGLGEFFWLFVFGGVVGGACRLV